MMSYNRHRFFKEMFALHDIWRIFHWPIMYNLINIDKSLIFPLSEKYLVLYLYKKCILIVLWYAKKKWVNPACMLHANITPFLMHVGVGGGKRGLSVKIQMAFDHRIIIKN